MAEDKKSFVAYADWKGQFDLLSNEEAGILIKHVFNYVKSNGSAVIEDNLLLDVAFWPIKIDLDKEISKRTFGKKHWNWKGGVSPKNHSIRNSSRMRDWRKLVFERDSYTCQDCGQVGGHLNAHHIKPFATHKNLRFDLNNGITLCKKCHINEHKRLRNEQKTRIHLVP